MKKIILIGLTILISASALAEMQYSGTAKIVDHFEEHHVALPPELREKSDNSMEKSVMAHANEGKERAVIQYQ